MAAHSFFLLLYDAQRTVFRFAQLCSTLLKRRAGEGFLGSWLY